MKVIIAGTRTIANAALVEQAIAESGFEITELVSGCADGVDRLGELWAERVGVPVVRYPANWKVYGKAAGPIRNQAMADHADALIGVWDGWSRGTIDMIRRAKAKGLKVYVHKLTLPAKQA